MHPAFVVSHPFAKKYSEITGQKSYFPDTALFQLLEDGGSAHATSHAHGDHAVAELAAAHLVEQRGGELCAGAAERVAEGDGASVDVNTLRVEAEFADDGESLRGKGFVEFDEADVGQGEASAAEGFGDGSDGTDAHLLGQAAGDGVGYQAAEGSKAQFMGVVGCHKNSGGCAVGDLRGVAGGDGSLGVEGGFELGQSFERGIGARASHPSDEELSPGAPASHPSDEELSPGAPVFAPGTEVVTFTGMSSSSKRPAACAASAFSWLAWAKAS